MARLLSLNVGLPREVNWNGTSVRTAIWKFPVEGRRMVRELNIDGDAQADLAGHGGEQRAVFVYQMDSYHHWKRYLGRNDFSLGQFGENFTVEGLADDEVCIGDRYRIGDAVFEATQRRVTCYRVGIRLNEPRMPALLDARVKRVSGKSGQSFNIVVEQHGAEDVLKGTSLLPYCLFTDPELARIGLSQTEAQAQGIPYRLFKVPMETNLRARTLSETRGFLKALVEAKSDRILGFMALGVGQERSWQLSRLR